MPRVTLSDGRWLDMRPIYISERRQFIELSRTAKNDAFVDYLEALVALVAPAVGGRSWDGPIDALTTKQLMTIVAEWHRLSEDDAVPPATGTPSPDSPSPESSEALTASLSE